MNYSIIRYILGIVLKLEGILMCLPLIVGIIYSEKSAYSYVITIAMCLIIGTILSHKKPKDTEFYATEGYITVSLSWVILSIFGCLPFVISGEIPSMVDALFETISGFTTTGASILSDVESLSYCNNMWRCFTHWIGGMGVLVFLLAVIPLTGGSNINLMKAESPGPSVGKLVPKIRYTARILYIIYFGMTVLQTILLLFGGMTFLDALNTAMGTAGTGGFGIRNDSFTSFSPYIQWVVTIFMILFGVNFNAYYLIVLRQFKKAVKVEEVRCYFGIILAATAIIFVNIYRSVGAVELTLRQSMFQVASIITTTGFSSVDFDMWPSLSKSVLVVLMFVGACAGSTGGGIKVSRFIIGIKTIFREIQSYIHPKSVKVIKTEGKPVDSETCRSVSIYFITFIMIFTASLLLISIEGKDIVTNFTAVAATINNIGPGLSAVGPTQNFGSYSDFSKYVLMFDMLAGRLELFPLIILFTPSIWKDLVTKKVSERKMRRIRRG